MTQLMPHRVACVRTPEERFANLPGYAFQPHFVETLHGFEGMRLHYVDENPQKGDAGCFLCLHGEPTWSYLYRKMIPVFARSQKRVVAPDFFGFGRSDKPLRDEDYTFGFHRNTVLRLIEKLDLRNITLVVQDWGGLIGLTLPMDMPERFSRLILMNTTLATGKSPGDGFDSWRAYAKANPDMDVGALMKRSTPVLSDDEAAAYSAPFPDISFKGGVRRFPQLVMTAPEMEGAETSRRSAQWLATHWRGESFMAVGMKDPVLGPSVMAALRQTIRGCPAPMEIPDGGHFVQEWGAPIAEAALKHFREC